MSTERTANVVLENKTSHKFLTAAIDHRYSDEDTQTGDWQEVKPNERSAAFSVKYRTGFWTTGQDWWAVRWVDDEGHAWVTSPRNGRAFVDFMEKKFWGYIAAKDRSPVPGYFNPEPDLARDVEWWLKNFKPTVGFKSFILRAKDDHATITVSIVEDQKGHYVVQYSAPSGTDAGNPVKCVH